MKGGRTLPLATLLIATFGVLVDLVFGWEPALVLGRVGFLGMCLAAVPRFELREWALALLATGCALGLVLQDDGGTKLLASLDLAVFFGTFIALLTLMKEAAERSASPLNYQRRAGPDPAARCGNAIVTPLPARVSFYFSGSPGGDLEM